MNKKRWLILSIVALLSMIVSSTLAQQSSPTVTIVQPVIGDDISTKFTFEATADHDSGIAQIEFFVNGTSVGVDDTFPYSIEVDVSNFKLGDATLEARATSVNGATGSSLEQLSESGSTAPQLIGQTPRVSEELAVNGAITLYFDQAMDAAATADSLSLTDAKGNTVPVTATWPDTKTVTLQPTSTLSPATTYKVTIADTAISALGEQFSDAVTASFTTVRAIEVTDIFPSDGLTNVSLDNNISVIFSRPVVALLTGEEQDNLPTPITLSPAVAGTGRWVNTSLYLFEPAELLDQATEYTIAIDADFVNSFTVNNAQMAEDVSVTFTTTETLPVPTPAPYPPSVTIQRTYHVDDYAHNNYPANGGTIWTELYRDDTSSYDTYYATHPNDPLNPSFQLSFNLEMDPASVDAGLTLVDANGNAVPLERSWDNYNRSLLITPTNQLEYNSQYELQLSDTIVDTENGLAINSDDRSFHFETAERPALETTAPINGMKVTRDGIDIFFNEPVTLESVRENITVEPELAIDVLAEKEGATKHILLRGLSASTKYTVSIGADVADPYGTTLGNSHSFTFTTGELDPRVDVALDQMAIYREGSALELKTIIQNVPDMKWDLYAIPQKTWQQLSLYYYYTGMNLYSYQPVQQPVLTVDTAITGYQNQAIAYPYEIRLTESGTVGDTPLPFGYYYLTMKTSAGDPDPYNSEPNHWGQKLVIANANVIAQQSNDTLLVWATDIDTDQPLNGVDVVLYDSNSNELLRGTTDANGVAMIEEPDGFDAIRKENSSSEWHIGLDDDTYFGIAPLNSYSFQNNTNNLMTYIYTDRPIYRPEQEVFIKSIIRLHDGTLDYKNPTVSSRNVQIIDPTGAVVHEETIQTNSMGSLELSHKLPEDAPLGTYNITVMPTDGTVIYQGFRSTFQVAEYRAPTYAINIEPEQKNVIAGEAIDVIASAEYYAGGAVSEGTVSAESSNQYSYFQANAPLDQYTFTNQETILQNKKTATGELNQAGKFEYTIQTDNISTMYQINTYATVQDATGNSVNSSTTINVHPSALYAGSKLNSYVNQANEEMSFNVASVDWDGNIAPSKQVDVMVYEVEYAWTYDWIRSDYGYYYGGARTIVKETAVLTTSVTTDENGVNTISFTPEKAGEYEIRTTISDDDGNEQSSQNNFYVSGSEPAYWGYAPSQVNLIADANRYAPGDVAKILIQAPFDNARALITTNRGGIFTHEVVELTSNSAIYELPITAEHAPNIHVSVTLIKGETADNNTQGEELYAQGSVNLPVDLIEQTLNIDLVSSDTNAQPGDVVTYTVQVTDHAGNPVEAELSLALSDLAVLSLQSPAHQPISDFFYPTIDIGTSTYQYVSYLKAFSEQQRDVDPLQFGLPYWYNALYHNLHDLGRANLVNSSLYLTRDGNYKTSAYTYGIHPLLQQPYDYYNKGSDGIVNDGLEVALPKPTAPNVEAGNGSADVAEIRDDFQDTAYWRAILATDANGQAEVAVTLPDNLTTWRMEAVAITADTLIGDAKTDIVSALPLRISPVLPRFFVRGDFVQAGAVVYNGTADAIATEVTLDADGVTMHSAETQYVTVPANSSLYVTWDISIDAVDRTDFLFSVAGGEHSDATRPTLSSLDNNGLEVFKYEVAETVGTSGQLIDDNVVVESIGLPTYDDYELSQGNMTIQVEPSLAAAMTAGLSYLEHYEYECTEQTVSRFLPNVLSYQALKSGGVTDVALEANLNKQVAIGLERLVTEQNPDGGWGWFGDMESDDLVSAYVVFGLTELQNAGYTVNQSVLNNGINFVMSNVGEVDWSNNSYHLNREAYELLVLANAGKDVSAYLPSQAQLQSLNLGDDGLAFIAQAIAIGNADDARLDWILNELVNRAILSSSGAHWENSDRYNWGTDTRTTAIVLDTLAMLDIDNPLVSQATRWLMAHRTNGHWYSTQETAWSLMALTNFMTNSGELDGNYEYEVAFNGSLIGQGAVDASNLREPVELSVPFEELNTDELNRLAIGRDNGDGNLYYTAFLNAWLPVEYISARDAGIGIKREYTLESDPNTPITEATQGDVVVGKLSITVPSEVHFVNIEDYLPAGLEFIDNSLLINQSAPEPDPYQSWRGWYDSDYFWGWNRWYFDYEQLRDEKMTLSADYLPAGTYEYTYKARATVPGEYRVIPPTAQEFYFPDVYGRGAGTIFTVNPMDGELVVPEGLQPPVEQFPSTVIISNDDSVGSDVITVQFSSRDQDPTAVDLSGMDSTINHIPTTLLGLLLVNGIVIVVVVVRKRM